MPPKGQRLRVTVTCQRCGKNFEVTPSRKDTAHFCSRKCHYDTATLTCIICGDQRKVKKSWLDRVFTCGSKECTHELKWRNFSDKVSAKIGEPLESAVVRRYVLERKSYREIVNELNVNTRVVMKILDRCGVEPRRGGEAIAIQWENNDERRESQTQAFAERRKNWVGPNHPRWQGGFKYDCSSDDWLKLAEQIRERDSYKCTRCGKTNEQSLTNYGRSLDVHHIIPFILSRDNSPNNLRALCLSCHRTIETEFMWLL